MTYKKEAYGHATWRWNEKLMNWPTRKIGWALLVYCYTFTGVLHGVIAVSITEVSISLISTGQIGPYPISAQVSVNLIDWRVPFIHWYPWHTRKPLTRDIEPNRVIRLEDRTACVPGFIGRKKECRRVYSHNHIIKDWLVISMFNHIYASFVMSTN